MHRWLRFYWKVMCTYLARVTYLIDSHRSSYEAAYVQHSLWLQCNRHSFASPFFVISIILLWKILLDHMYTTHATNTVRNTIHIYFMHIGRDRKLSLCMWPLYIITCSLITCMYRNTRIHIYTCWRWQDVKKQTGYDHSFFFHGWYRNHVCYLTCGWSSISFPILFHLVYHYV